MALTTSSCTSATSDACRLKSRSTGAATTSPRTARSAKCTSVAACSPSSPMRSAGFADVDVHVKYLRNLQSLRSTGVGHRKGSGYEKAAAAVGIGTKPLSMVFADLLAGATVLLDALRAHFLAVAPSAP